MRGGTALILGGAKLSAASGMPEVQETKWIMGEVERGDEEEEDGGREKSRSPLGCSCQGSGEADVIHLIGSYRLSEGFFSVLLGQR